MGFGFVSGAGQTSLRILITKNEDYEQEESHQV